MKTEQVSDIGSESSMSSEGDTSQNSMDYTMKRLGNVTTLVSLDGIQSCVPTRTTATLTPTTMRNIEQTYMELTSDLDSSKSGQAGFVPPLPSFPEQDYSTGLSSIDSVSNSSWQQDQTPPPIGDDIVSNLQASSDSNRGRRSDSRKNMGGRRPNKPSNLTAEEEEKRRIRRERNKLAAARCRKRRVDQTNELLGKVDELEREKQRLRNEVKTLNELKDELEYHLRAHMSSTHCVVSTNNTDTDVKPIFGEMPKIKEEPLDLLDGPPSPKRMMLSNSTLDLTSEVPTLNTPMLTSAMKRPNSLNLDLKITSSQKMGKSIADIAGIPITTPSSGFNYISLMNGGTGLTPVSAPLQPNSPMLRNSMELQTPTSEPSKLVSL